MLALIHPVPFIPHGIASNCTKGSCFSLFYCTLFCTHGSLGTRLLNHDASFS
jgi:hypothetical protein